MIMGKKDEGAGKEKLDRVQSVLQILRKQAPLTVKQVSFRFISFATTHTLTFHCVFYIYIYVCV